MENKKFLYRFVRYYDEDVWNASTNYRIRLEEYEVVKKTPQGFWIVPKGCSRCKQKFVLNHKDGEDCKRFAYRTKEDAFKSFRQRTVSSIGFSKSNLRNALNFVKAHNEHELCVKPINLVDFIIDKTTLTPQDSEDRADDREELIETLSECLEFISRCDDWMGKDPEMEKWMKVKSKHLK